MELEELASQRLDTQDHDRERRVDVELVGLGLKLDGLQKWSALCIHSLYRCSTGWTCADRPGISGPSTPQHARSASRILDTSSALVDLGTYEES